MNVRALSLMMLSALLLAGGVAWAGPGGRGPGGRGPDALLDPGRLDRAAERLGLDDATLEKVKARAYTAQKEAITAKAELKVARIELHRLLDTDAPDKKAVLAQVERVGQLETTLRRLKVSALLDIRALLTPEQRAQLKTMQRGRGHREGRRGRRGPRDRRGPPDAPPPPPPPGE
ncbi:MAG: periplasmic heavy metal sensor [Myxococcales bacterium]|nr:periplasmic heavy metal sensor [Myxococcales bacterium]